MKSIKKRLLFVNGHLNVGGVERSLVDILNCIDYLKYDVDLLLFEEIGDYRNEIPKEVNVIFYDISNTYGELKSVIKLAIKNKDYFTIYFRLTLLLEKIFGVKSLYILRPIFKKLKIYDCAIAYRVGFCSEFVAYVVKANKKITWWHHGEYNYNHSYSDRLLSVYSKFDKIIAVSEGCKNILIDKFSTIIDKIEVIPNIIDTKRIRDKSIEFNVDYLKNNNINIVSIGRLSPEKGMINCIYVCKRLIEKGHKVNWFLIGDGIQYEDIKNAININNLTDSVFLKGSLINPYPYLYNCDIYVHPSYVESMSITVLEAMTLQRPVIVAKSVGPQEFILNEENGILVDPTVEGLYRGICKVLNDKELLSKISRNNYTLLENYSSEVVINKIFKLIES